MKLDMNKRREFTIFILVAIVLILLNYQRFVLHNNAENLNEKKITIKIEI